ncbi:MAG: IPT/TIG domain-containing protein [Acidovorax sp.]|uniref:choice-of-anchor U domain-containing protein n=1 Tax=Acidovorax sp. TaxID=1872122 RepID=UPI00261E5961|nr:choice-of-anchor U domain-containing protein [Acidovorax sp.]MDH4465576.1 IPT/TIG domain-containing protein [Acidovorax sp.]
MLHLQFLTMPFPGVRHWLCLAGQRLRRGVLALLTGCFALALPAHAAVTPGAQGFGTGDPELGLIGELNGIAFNGLVAGDGQGWVYGKADTYTSCNNCAGRGGFALAENGGANTPSVAFFRAASPGDRFGVSGVRIYNPSAANTGMTVRGYRNGSVVQTVSLTLTRISPMLVTYDLGLTDVDQVSFTSSHDWFFAIDDLGIAPLPTVTGVSPVSGAGAGGTTVVITGSGFTAAGYPGGTAVRFGTTLATSTVDSDTQITATAPAGTGTVDITVTTAGGVSATGAASQFSYVASLQPQTISFANPGARNFGTAPTLTATATSGLPVSFSSSTTGVCTISSGGVLSFVATGNCTINANQAGNGSYDAAPQVTQTFTVNPVVPGAPTTVVASASDTQASVAFAAPASNGGSNITGYTVTSTPGNITATGAAPPILVSGLTNGQAYTFTVTATNGAGTGPASAASSPVVPRSAQSIVFSTPIPQTFGTTGTLTATATSGLPVTFSSATPAVCAITSGGGFSFLTAGACTVNADQAGDASFLPAARVQRTFQVNPRLGLVSTVQGMTGFANVLLSGGGVTCTFVGGTTQFMTPSGMPSGRTAPHGGFEFRAVGCVGSVTITIAYPEPLPAGVSFWKFGPASPGAASSWFAWSGATLSGDRRTVSYTITDNGVGDGDPAAGAVLDPFVPALGGAADAVSIPVDAPWALALMSAVIGWLGWRRTLRAAPSA